MKGAPFGAPFFLPVLGFLGFFQQPSFVCASDRAVLCHLNTGGPPIVSGSAMFHCRSMEPMSHAAPTGAACPRCSVGSQPDTPALTSGLLSWKHFPCRSQSCVNQERLRPGRPSLERRYRKTPHDSPLNSRRKLGSPGIICSDILEVAAERFQSIFFPVDFFPRTNS